ncbi:hypothetical protein V493_01190 [Pseudogymnoascus sp. VKM F-4281 (FW-2241)]|nr:hypothetical protein V493_01190 [Pseudogymnoascus sp. VKM F-4281 (FW-2241)]
MRAINRTPRSGTDPVEAAISSIDCSTELRQKKQLRPAQLFFSGTSARIGETSVVDPVDPSDNLASAHS